MSLFAKLMQGITGTGAHRAADRIPELRAEAEYWKAVALEAQGKLEHADRLVKKVCREKAAIEFNNARLEAELDTYKQGHELLSNNYNELSARFTEVNAALLNARKARVPAPADHEPAIPHADPEATQDLRFMGPLWDVNALKKTAAA